jgi:hypothetical protein
MKQRNNINFDRNLFGSPTNKNFIKKFFDQEIKKNSTHIMSLVKQALERRKMFKFPFIRLNQKREMI